MVKGFEIFRKHFRDFADRYVLIGGTACDIIMSEAGLSFRATKDLDIVLCVEALDADFARVFWSFVESGGYTQQEKSTGRKQFYRFKQPQNSDFPTELELFSRVPDVLHIIDEHHLTPIPVDEEVNSLSAILLNDQYYRWIHAGKEFVEDVYIVSPEYVIPLKGKAWLDLKSRKENGERIDSSDIKKHKNDVFRIFQILRPQPVKSVPDSIKTDMQNFLNAMETEPVDLKNLGIRSHSKSDVIAELRNIYGIA